MPNLTNTFENLAIEGVGANFDNGIYSYNSQSNLILRSSTITGTGGNPVLVEQHSGPLDIDGNQITPASSASGSSIFVMTYGNVNVTTTQRVRNNTITIRGVTFNGAVLEQHRRHRHVQRRAGDRQRHHRRRRRLRGLAAPTATRTPAAPKG